MNVCCDNVVAARYLRDISAIVAKSRKFLFMLAPKVGILSAPSAALTRSASFYATVQHTTAIPADSVPVDIVCENNVIQKRRTWPVWSVDPLVVGGLARTLETQFGTMAAGPCLPHFWNKNTP
jgi:predicted anti-sigma-YlaC factor YlaD